MHSIFNGRAGDASRVTSTPFVLKERARDRIHREVEVQRKLSRGSIPQRIGLTVEENKRYVKV